MNSLILRAATRFLVTLLLLFSVFLLWRGHNAPGGGFIAGLVASASFTLYALAYGPGAARASLRVQPTTVIATGLLVAGVSGLVGVAGGAPFLTGRWTALDLPGFPPAELGTPLLFDTGVFLVVIGVTLTIILSLAEE